MMSFFAMELHGLLPSDYQVYGLDFTKHFIDEAKEAHPGNCYVVHDACQPYPFSGFDVVICVELLEHVPAPALVIQNIYDALKPGGSAIISTPNALSRELRFCMKRDWKIPESVYQYLTPTVLEGMIREMCGKITYSDWRAKYRFGHIYLRFER
jgi:2-polyprenyl-3-methyl-5-hydroxy-6-metoxy-1,4-benzoquinol methylase